MPSLRARQVLSEGPLPAGMRETHALTGSLPVLPEGLGQPLAFLDGFPAFPKGMVCLTLSLWQLHPSP